METAVTKQQIEPIKDTNNTFKIVIIVFGVIIALLAGLIVFLLISSQNVKTNTTNTPVSSSTTTSILNYNNTPISTSTTTPLPDPNSHKIVEIMACADNCDSSDRSLFVNVYQNINSKEECDAVNGEYLSYTGWSVEYYCKVK